MIQNVQLKRTHYQSLFLAPFWVTKFKISNFFTENHARNWPVLGAGECNVTTRGQRTREIKSRMLRSGTFHLFSQVILTLFLGGDAFDNNA